MRPPAYLAAGAALLAGLAGCAPPASPPPPPPSTASHEVHSSDLEVPAKDVRAAVPRSALPDESPPPEPPSATARALAGVLRPIDSPLPSRASLDRGYADPVAVLLELSAESWPDGLVRANALAELGLFPQHGEAMGRLLEVAQDQSRPVNDRGGALEGLIVAGDAIAPHVLDLLPLLESETLIVQASAVRLLGPWPEARAPIQRLAAAEDTHFDVRRFARRALESTNEER